MAMLAVSKVLEDYTIRRTGRIAKDAFKIVYVAPMKALAGEMVDNFIRRLETFDLSIVKLTGEDQLTGDEVRNAQVRKWHWVVWFIDLTSIPSSGDHSHSGEVGCSYTEECPKRLDATSPSAHLGRGAHAQQRKGTGAGVNCSKDVP